MKLSIPRFTAALALTLPIWSQPSANQIVVWRDHGDIRSLNVLEGPGGKDRAPGSAFEFIKKSEDGTAPKFVVKDENGGHWKVKLGEEAKPETAAALLLWAAGYMADEDYYRPEIRVHGMKAISHGTAYISQDGLGHKVLGARLERIEEEKKAEKWSWHQATKDKEFNGLRVMMALLNNWDLKTENNSVHHRGDADLLYTVSDLGASFGRTGSSFTRSKGVLEDYAKSKFIHHVHGDHVDFVMHSRPFFLTAIFRPDYYIRRVRIQSIVKHIPLPDARWLGQQLGRLSPLQIADCFRAAGFSAQEVEGYSRVVRQRIETLNQL